MPPLHEALVEVQGNTRLARDMAELYKNATATSDVLNDKCKRMQAEKDELSEKL